MSKDKPFNSGLQDLAKLKQKLADDAKAAEAARVEAARKEQERTLKLSEAPKDDGAEAFLRAMAGVSRLGEDPRGVRQKAVVPKVERVDATDHDDDALLDLAAMVDPQDFEGDVHAGAQRNLDRKILKTLKAGAIPYADTLDLHGLRKDEALRQLDRFILAALRTKHKCVLVITGRGLHSEEPVLKNAAVQALRRLPKNVLAYAEAQPKHGGEGAYYVLLRRR